MSLRATCYTCQGFHVYVALSLHVGSLEKLCSGTQSQTTVSSSFLIVHAAACRRTGTRRQVRRVSTEPCVACIFVTHTSMQDLVFPRARLPQRACKGFFTHGRDIHGKGTTQ